LFVPGNHPHRIAKALGSHADAVIIDLEDAVPLADKASARQAAADAAGPAGRCRLFIRVNGVDGSDCYPDLLAIVQPGLKGIVVPKAEVPEQLRILDWVVGQLEHERGLEPGAVELLPLVETARGVAAIEAMAASSARIRRMSFGIADYSLDLGLQPTADEAQLQYIRARLVHGSRAAGLEPPVDSVVVEVRDPERFRASAERARSLGMAGKLCIHPDQVPIANRVFAPTAREIERARAIVEAFDAAGSSAITVGGEFVDVPVVEHARRVLALAEQGGAGQLP
jgi:citrate lyase subunit beta/citryl-CoA lyase